MPLTRITDSPTGLEGPTSIPSDILESKRSSALHLNPEYNEKLQLKIQSQAEELSAIVSSRFIFFLSRVLDTRHNFLPAQSQKLKITISYSELCEKRIQELAPGHTLPVTEDCLGVFLTTTAAEGKNDEKLKSDTSKPCDVSGIPAYVIARNALSRRLERESEAQIFSLKKTVRSLEDKNSDLTKQLKRTRLERDSKEREVWKPM